MAIKTKQFTDFVHFIDSPLMHRNSRSCVLPQWSLFLLSTTTATAATADGATASATATATAATIDY